MLGLLAVDLAFLLAVDAAEADTFRVLVVQDFDGVALDDGDAREAAQTGGAGTSFSLASRCISGKFLWRIARRLFNDE